MLSTWHGGFKILHNKNAQSVMELALIMPIFILILFGIFQIGSALVIEQTLIYAAREGARMGALTNSNEQIESAIAIATQFVDENHDKIRIEIDPSEESDRIRGSTLVVRVEYDFDLVLYQLLNKTLTLSAQASSRTEI